MVKHREMQFQIIQSSKEIEMNQMSDITANIGQYNRVTFKSMRA